MAMWLKQSTAITVKVGPFIDPSTGDAETALTITQADVRLSVNGGNMAQKNDSTSCTHDEIGIYDCPLNATDTGTLGRIQLFIHESGALPVWHDFMVVPANVWDSMFGADKLQSHVVEFTSGVIDSAAIDATAAAEISDAVWDEALSGHTTAGSAGKAVADAAAISPPSAGAIADAVWDETAGDHTSAGTTGQYLALGIPPSAGTIADAVWDEARSGHTTDGTFGDTAEWAGGGSAPSAADIADAVWDEALSGHTSAGSAGEALDTAATASGATPADIADAVWDEARSGHTTDGTFGDTAEWAGGGGSGPSAADIADAVWDEALAGHTTAGTAGKAVADAAAISPPSTSSIADAVWDEALAGHTTAGSSGKAVADAAAISPPSAGSIADTVWDEALSGHSVAGSAGKALTDAGNPFGGTNSEVSAGAEPTTHAGLLRMIYNRFYRRAELTDSALKTYVKDAAGGSSGVLTTQDVSDDGTTQIQEQSTYPA